MNIKTYNYVKQCLEIGHKVKVQYAEDISVAKFFEAPAGSYVTLTNDSLFEYESVKTTYTDYYKIIPRPPKLLQTGDKCVIIDTPEIRKWAEDNDWSGQKVNMIGKESKVTRFNNGYYNLGDYMWEIPYFMVAPVPPEDNKLANVDTEEMVKELESRGLLVNGEVLK